MNRFRFVPNVPQIVSLASQEEEYDSEAEQVSYLLEDGRTLILPRADAARLNLLELQPGETFGLCKRWHDEREISTHLDIWLTSSTEQARAAAEQEARREKPAASVKPYTRSQKVLEMRPDPPAQPEPQKTQGNGTYGPAPRPAIAATASARIPFNLAFTEAVRIVRDGLKETGEQWDDASRQGAVSTILIAATKAGWIGPWER